MDPLEAVVRPPLPTDLRTTLGPLRHGGRDPTVRFVRGALWRATRTPLGATTVSYESRGDDIVVRAWGPGAEHAISTAPEVLGLRDDLTDWRPDLHPLVARLDRRFAGLRFIRTGAVLEELVPTILEQKVQSAEAHESWRLMAWRWGEEAPGPGVVRLPPSARRLATEPYHAYHRFNLERKRADIVRFVASRAARVEEAVELGRRRLEAFPGIGAWTSGKVAQVAWGDADAVPVGDFHLPSIVVHAFTGNRRGTDEEMLELLEPFRPHRARVARMLKMGVGKPARRAPRMAFREFRTA